jgi:1,4-alpha-glucan branching enzyme/maltooligosyltrehalose trehalohydrolase
LAGRELARPDILSELAECVQQRFDHERHIHLVLENDTNAAHYLTRDARNRPQWYVAHWNDDIHHALHVLLTREQDGYYRDFAEDPLRYLARCLAEGFACQGESSAYRENTPRGEPSAYLPTSAFVPFLQNHDQAGNRAFGERIGVLIEAAPLRAAMALLLLAPSPPLLFMGQEWGCTPPFPFFCNFGPDLVDKVVSGRRNEFSHFPQFRDPDARERIPDPMDRRTFESAVLDWQLLEQSESQTWLRFHRQLLGLRRQALIPRLHRGPCRSMACHRLGPGGLSARWVLADGGELVVLAILHACARQGLEQPSSPILISPESSIYYLYKTMSYLYFRCEYCITMQDSAGLIHVNSRM